MVGSEQATSCRYKKVNFIDIDLIINSFLQVYLSILLDMYEPPHDKTNKMIVCPAKTQISLGICPVCSESSLCAEWVAKGPSFLHEDSVVSYQTGRMPRLI